MKFTYLTKSDRRTILVLLCLVAVALGIIYFTDSRQETAPLKGVSVKKGDTSSRSRYYYQGELMLTNSSSYATSWSLSNHRLERSDNHTLALAFNPANSRWTLAQNGNTDVAYQAKHTLHHSGTYYDLASCLSDPIAINNENVDYVPNWVAMKEGTTRSFSTRPKVSLNIYTLPRHERYSLAVDGEITSPEFFYYEGFSYSHISDIPSRSESKNILDSRDFVTGQNSTDERLTVEWHVVNAEGEEVTDAPFTLNASSSNNTFLSTLTRTGSLSAPATYYLQATIDYQLDGNRNYDIPIHATATSNRLPVIADRPRPRNRGLPLGRCQRQRRSHSQSRSGPPLPSISIVQRILHAGQRRPYP